METGDAVLAGCPSPMRQIVCLIINGVLPVVLTTVKSLYNLTLSLAELETARYESEDEVMECDTEQVSTCPDGHDSWLRGYTFGSLPKRTYNLISKSKAAKLLKRVNREIRKEILENLKQKKQDFEDQISYKSIKAAVLKQTNATHLLDQFDNETVTTIMEILLSESMAKWIIQKAKADAVLEALKLKEKPVPTGKEEAKPRGIPTRKKIKPNPTADTATANIAEGKKQKVSKTAPINIIGKIFIPKTIYNFLGLGAKFACEHTQRENCTEAPEITGNNISELQELQALNETRARKLIQARVTSEMFVEIKKLFVFLESACGVDPHQLWNNFWNSNLTKMELVHSVFRPINGKMQKNPYKRLTDFLCGRNLIVKMADKNAGITVMKVEWYIKHMTEHLKTVDTYEMIQENPKESILKQLEILCENHKSKPGRWYDDKVTKIVNPQIYLMPKIHKTPIGFRPIIPSHSWYTTKAAKYLHNKLYPLLEQKYGWVITDRLKLIQELETKEFESKKMQLATIDVTALYTSIDLEKGLDIIAVLMQPTFKEWEVPFYINLLRWVLKNNYFQFQGNWYKQTRGAAMGGNASGIFADLVVAGIERTKFRSFPKADKPLLYRRYRDDILLSVKNIKAAKMVAKALSSCEMLKFNLEQFGQSVNFLDITISKGDRFHIKQKLDLKPFRKPTSKNSYVHYATYKPESTKMGWITGEQIRMLRASQDRKSYNLAMAEFLKNLKRSGYPPQLLRSRTQYRFEDRNWLIEKADKMDQNWYAIDTTRMGHEKWNFLQNNFKPLLKFHNVQLTAHKGRTTMDALNMAAKKVLKAPDERQTEQAAKQLALFKQRETVTRKMFRQKCNRLTKSGQADATKHFWSRELKRLQKRGFGDHSAHPESSQPEPRPSPCGNASKRRRSHPDQSACEMIPQRIRNQDPSRAPSTWLPPRKKRATNAAT
jgi:hypothetical protein